jgi:hypothetical protein
MPEPLTEKKPTAKQLVELGHAIPVNWLLATAAAGLATDARVVRALANDPDAIARSVASATVTLDTTAARPFPRPRRHPARSRGTRSPRRFNIFAPAIREPCGGGQTVGEVVATGWVGKLSNRLPRTVHPFLNRSRVT